MREYEAGIIRTERSGGAAFILGLSCPGIAREVLPGQFVQVRVSEGTDPFLRRTFSVCDADAENGEITLLIDEIGRGTAILCSLKRGGCVSVIGPLGRGFDPGLGGEGPCLLVAGGTGAAPLLFLFRRLLENGVRAAAFLAGARTAESLAAVRKLVPANADVSFATDDGSLGYRGFVSGLMAEALERGKSSAVFACGPLPMMRAVAGLAARSVIPCQVSLEERMACGIGACLGCAVKMRDGSMVRSCVDGPVFDAGEVLL